MSGEMRSETRYRTLALAELRAVDREAREATLVAASQARIETRAGGEVLLLSGLGLGRFNGNPILLDSHQAGTVDAVLGSAREVAVEGDRLVARVRFAGGGAVETRADRAWTLVRDGHLRGVSVAYRALETRRVAAGAVDPATRVAGPALLVVRSELLELSLIAVPSDPSALVAARAASAQRAAPLAVLDLAAMRRAFGNPVRA